MSVISKNVCIVLRSPDVIFPMNVIETRSVMSSRTGLAVAHAGGIKSLEEY